MIPVYIHSRNSKSTIDWSCVQKRTSAVQHGGAGGRPQDLTFISPLKQHCWGNIALFISVCSPGRGVARRLFGRTLMERRASMPPLWGSRSLVPLPELQGRCLNGSQGRSCMWCPCLKASSSWPVTPWGWDCPTLCTRRWPESAHAALGVLVLLKPV